MYLNQLIFHPLKEPSHPEIVKLSKVFKYLHSKLNYLESIRVVVWDFSLQVINNYLKLALLRVPRVIKNEMSLELTIILMRRNPIGIL